MCRTFAVKVADFAQEMERGGVTCFASPDSGVQNGYWVNTTHTVCMGYCSGNFGTKFPEIGAANYVENAEICITNLKRKEDE